MGGAIAMFIGFMIYYGTRTSTGNFGYQYASSSGDQDAHERVRRDWKERFANEMLMVVAIIIGGIPMLLGILVHRIWG